MMTTSERGLALIMECEGFCPEAYLCPAGVWTIGYGHTGGVRPGERCSRDEARDWLGRDVGAAEQAVRRHVRIPLAQAEFDALVSFVFNVGTGAFAASTLLRKLGAGDRAGAAAEFDRWVRGGDRVLPGLVTRRARERALFEEAREERAA